MCTRNEKDHHCEETVVRGLVSSRVRVYYDLGDRSSIHSADILPLDAGIIRKRTYAWYEKYVGEVVTEPEIHSIFTTAGIDFLGIEDASDSASVYGSSSEKACGCGDQTGLCGPPL